jgi:hypothetical protein
LYGVQITVVWNVTLEIRKQVGLTNISEETAAFIKIEEKMEAAVFLETAAIYKTTRHHTQEEGTLDTYRREKFKSYRMVLIWWMSVPYRTVLRNSLLVSWL